MVSTGQEPQTDSQEHQAGRSAHPLPQWHALNILLLIILLGLFLLSFNLETNYESGIQRINFTVGDHPVLEMRPGSHETPFVAIVVHGFSGSKELMSTFGTELAHAGVTTYLLDLPGHGESSTPAQYNSPDNMLKDNVAAIHDLVTFVQTPPDRLTPTPTTASTPTPRGQSTPTAQATATPQAQSTPTPILTPQPQNTPAPQGQNPQPTTNPNPKIILIGHSMGAAAVANYLMHQKDSKETANIIANVLISPTGQDMPTTKIPRNLLVLAGSNDFANVLNTSKNIFNSACPASSKIQTPQTRECGKVDEDTGRRLVIIAGSDHMTILNTNNTFQEILSWLHQVEPKITSTNVHADSRLLGLIFGALCIILAVFPLCALLIDIFAIRANVSVTRGIDLLFFLPCLLIGIAIALAIQLIWRPLAFIHLAISNYTVGYFFIVALVMALLLVVTRRRLPLPPRSQVAQQILAGVIPAVLLYLTLGQLITFTWQRILFNWPRLLDFVLIAILLFPLFLIGEGVVRGYHTKNALHTIIADLAFKGLLIAGLFIAPWISTEPNLDFLEVLLPILGLVLILLAGVCTQFYHSGRAALAGAIFSTLIMAWCLATTFPIT